MADLLTFPELTTEFIRRVITYSDELSHFGENGPNFALARADAGLGAQHQALHRALLRRNTLIGAAEGDLVEVASEYGARQRGGSRSRMLVVMRPFVASVTAITGALIEVDDSSAFDAADSIRIRSGGGTPTEILNIAAITTGTGPNGGDELNVGSLVNVYDPITEAVSVLLRETVQEGTVIQTQAGVDFETIADVTIGDLNPVLDGESEALSLNDKVWAEATIRGPSGNVDARTVTGFETPNAHVKDLFNPERAFAGNPVETDYALKRRASHQAQDLAQETQAFFESMARKGNRNVLRVLIGESTFINTIQLILVSRNATGLATNELNALTLYLSQRVRSRMDVELVNVVMTSVEIEATITLDPGSATARERLTAAYVAAADRFANFLDFRKWNAGDDVDEADLSAILVGTPGVASLVTSTFFPGSDVVVSPNSVPVFTRLGLTDSTSGLVQGSDLTPEFA